MSGLAIGGALSRAPVSRWHVRRALDAAWWNELVLFGYAPILAGLALVVEGLAMVWVCGAASLAALTLGVISFREQRRYLDFVVALCNNREELALVDATPAPSLSAEWACWRRVLILSAVVFLVLFGLGLWAAKW